MWLYSLFIAHPHSVVAAVSSSCAIWDFNCIVSNGIAAATANAIGWFFSNLGTLAKTVFLNVWVWLMGGIDPNSPLANPVACVVTTDWSRGTVTLSPASCTYPVLTWVDGDMTGGANSFGATLAAFYGYVQPAGMMVVAVAAAARIVKVMFEHRAPGHAIILDVLPRAGIGMLAIAGAPAVLLFLVLASGAIGHGWWSTLSGHITSSGVGAMAVGQGIFIGIAAFILTFITGGTFLLIFLLPVLVVVIMVLYLLVLWVGRMIILLFCFTTAPVCLACAVYDPGNRFTKWWLSQFMTALVMPSVIAVGAGVTLMAATTVASIPPYIVGTLLSFVILIGGLWFTGKAVHGLMGDTFSHGGVMKAIEMAGAAMAFAPQAISRMPGGTSMMKKLDGPSLRARGKEIGGVPKVSASGSAGSGMFDGLGFSEKTQSALDTAGLSAWGSQNASYVATHGGSTGSYPERVKKAYGHWAANDPAGAAAYKSKALPHALGMVRGNPLPAGAGLNQADSGLASRVSAVETELDTKVDKDQINMPWTDPTSPDYIERAG